VYAHGSDQFSEVSAFSKRLLQYAWVTSNEDELEDWRQFCNVGGADPIDALIMSVMTNAAARLRKIVKNDSAGKNVTDARELGMFVSTSSVDIANALKDAGVSNPEDDEHYKAAFERLNAAFFAAARGEDPFAAMNVNVDEIGEDDEQADPDED
jgi:hypothetical protein